DEYEGARLYTNGDFEKKLKAEFEGPFTMKFHLAPPLLAKRDPVSGELKKQEFGAWTFPLFKLLARLKFLRGTPLDIFGHTAERRMERQLIVDYQAVIAEMIDALTPEKHAIAVSLA